VADIAEHSPNLHFDSILADLNPRPVEPGRLRPLPENLEEELKKYSFKLLLKGQTSFLSDVAYAMGVDYAQLRDRLRKEAETAPVTEADALLAQLADDPHPR